MVQDYRYLARRRENSHNEPHVPPHCENSLYHWLKLLDPLNPHKSLHNSLSRSRVLNIKKNTLRFGKKKVRVTKIKLAQYLRLNKNQPKVGGYEGGCTLAHQSPNPGFNIRVSHKCGIFIHWEATFPSTARRLW
jgi:hypothetical protein